jgi:hypothetical protein
LYWEYKTERCSYLFWLRNRASSAIRNSSILIETVAGKKGDPYADGSKVFLFIDTQFL